ncbi:30S ribosomal protein S4 [Brachyspira hampsonii]|uniref:Small ribosomal subunit protein uS4 n=1 Tax=Brachyspira hampsonii TaxID=1287055 RepID=A0AAC9XJY3_9SPIR|nr:30S ribosomal protein S4 [Brachyspira hampsonii]ASJ21105.1 30S ribosomal protein S4 [Brachyspira hampsonii]ELV06817.1 30S ribosomal protein S4 [Brachyspira hampsonii 30599]MBW5379591.1 30S ribosomal protein S4 [Brachyspira hampsonii]MBW5408872.1 30S ribosomal protein S4 [Brachyspira hampsonii]OEJ16808.1 30S ribosomal protein S4 [Brachyspira hampsonii]
MARYRDASCRLCRREKMKLMLKGDRCLTAKCAITKKRDVPGPANRKMKQLSEYGIQMREKQKVKRIYGVLEKQFRNYYHEAIRVAGVSGENLLRLLELRLDNVVYRLGLAKSRSQARQFVAHGFISVNGKGMTIPSYCVKVGDKISITDRGNAIAEVKTITEGLKSEYVPAWLSLDLSSKTGEIVTLPIREHIEYPINEQLIIEYYSK